MAEHERAGDFHAGAADDAVEGLAGHAHADGGFGVEEILDVREAESLQLVGGEDDLLQFVKRNAGGFEVVAGRPVGDAAGAEGAGHGRSARIRNRDLRDDVMGICSLSDEPSFFIQGAGRPSPLPMKIAIPLTATDEFSPHYGAAAKFAVMEVDPDRRVVLRRLLVAPQASEPCQWPTLLRAAGVDLVLAGGMGRGARQHMAEHGLDVLVGMPTATPDALVAAWLEGRLVAGPNACGGNGQPHHPAAGDSHEHSGCGCAH